MNRQEKTDLVGTLSGDFAKAKAAYLTGFTGMTAVKCDELRKRVREAGGRYRVIKNTIARISTKETSIHQHIQKLKGPVGWAYTEADPVALAKVLKKFREENEVFSYSGGFLEGEPLDAKGVDSLSEMPPREVILAQLLGMISGPARSLATVVQAVPRSLVTVIEQIRKKKEESNNG